MKAMIFACLLCGLATASAHATTWYIKPDGTGDAPTIQAGIDSAAVGDEVVLACGTYYEIDIIMKSGITLRSETGQPGCATIDAQLTGNIMQCVGLAAGTVVEGVTMTNGRRITSLGAALHVVGGDPDFVNCDFIANDTYFGPGFPHAAERDFRAGLADASLAEEQARARELAASRGFPPDGGAVYVDGGATDFIGCRFIDNGPAYSAGGGVGAFGATLGLTGCTFSNNSADVGGGAVFLHSCVGGTISECTFSNNGLEGIWAWDSPLVVRECAFIANWGYQGAIAVHGGGGVVEDCTVIGTESHEGAITASRGHVEIRRTVIADSWGVWGAAVGCERLSSGLIEECLLYGNNTWEAGTIWFVDADSWTVDRCTISDNGHAGGSAPGASGIYLGPGPWTPGASNVTVISSILSYGHERPAVVCDEPLGQIVLQCTDVYGNEGGDWVGCIASQAGQDGNFWANPAYCDTANGDYTIQSDSPCAPPGVTGCGLVGALPVGCGPVALTPESWARVKGGYR